jgi:hypothetical protein
MMQQAYQYELRHIPIGRYELVGIGEVDFSKIDLKTVARLARNTPYLVARETSAPVKQSSATV